MTAKGRPAPATVREAEAELSALADRVLWSCLRIALGIDSSARVVFKRREPRPRRPRKDRGRR
jgi:hypothetical protein